MCEKDEEEKDMATKALTNNYTLSEIEASMIINSPIKKVKPTNAMHDFMLSKEKKAERARKILDSRK